MVDHGIPWSSDHYFHLGVLVTCKNEGDPIKNEALEC